MITKEQYQSDIHNRMVIISCIGDTITKEQAAEMLVPIDERIYLYNNPKNDDNNNS